MRDLIEDLLLLARADEHQFSGRRGDVDLDEIIDAEQSRLQANSGLAVRSSISASPVTRANSRGCSAIWSTTPPGTRAVSSMRCELQGRVAVIRVADDGPGIPREQWARVFDRLVRLNAPRARLTVTLPADVDSYVAPDASR